MVTNQEILETIKIKLEEKNEVIREQQEMIQELQSQVADLESKLGELESLEKERMELLDQLKSLE